MKKWYRSRLLWLGVLTVLGAAASSLAAGAVGWREIAISCIGALIVFLRMQTTAKLGSEKKAGEVVK